MIAILKRVHSPDISDLINYQPPEKNNFSFLLQAFIGPKDAEGEESFDFEVCTPDWLKENYSDEAIVFGKNRLIVFKYNYECIMESLSQYCETCTGKSWDEVAEKVGRIGKWEFEDYIEFHNTEKSL